ncbi:MAG: coenzyme F420-0:L-glutamate ligase [Cellvibrionales bacterium]|jgi:coenzyme F420-0:L-glutamate ligase/coenzyme F420-1:gamma-L-glutamate ligase|nr:coenzyme F420-0:L-glutamate ligase [Cellvibrionales bacterium]MBK8676814.1 coenzyme F420-0:L-glutamate ligase [Cellvibrionales bacterium]
MSSLQLFALRDFPLVNPGDDLAALIQQALQHNAQTLCDGDILVLAQKIVSKAENRYRALNSITPTAEAEKYAAETGKDPRMIDLVLQESNRVLRHRFGSIVVEHKLGFVHANAGIDQSNLPDNKDSETALLLPENPDASAQQLRAALQQQCGAKIAVLINDSFGRAWRLGTCGIAIGVAGFEPLLDLRGAPDLFGRRLEITQVGIADEIAAAASLLMGQAGEGSPVVIVRGLHWPAKENASVQTLLRKPQEDMFR